MCSEMFPMSSPEHIVLKSKEEFLENQYLQDYYEEDEKYLERPEAQQFYKD